MHSLLRTTFGILILSLPIPASSTILSISTDRNNLFCVAHEQPIGVTKTYFVAAQASIGGITGVEFRISGLPVGYYAWTSDHQTPVQIGDPLREGTNIAFSECQASGGGTVPLFTLQVARYLEGAEPVILFIEPRLQPSNPFFDCSLVTLCDAPVFTKQCVAGFGVAPEGGIVPDPSQPSPAHGASNVAVGPTLLEWETQGPLVCCGLGVSFTIIRFGTDPDPPVLFNYYDYPPYEVDLVPNTTYYWQVTWTPDTDCDGGTSPVWSFTTADGPVNVRNKTWSEVKSVFR